MSFSVNDNRTQVVKVFLEEVTTTGGTHYEVRYNVKGNSASMSCGNAALKSGSISRISDDKFTVIDTVGNKRTFYIGTVGVTEGGNGFTSVKQEEQKKEKKSKKSKKQKRGYWGFWKEKLGGWVWLASPLLLILWIPILVLKLIWTILKLVLTVTGLKFIFSIFAGGGDD